MAFAGGPYNHGALDGAARMVEVLREGSDAEQKRGLVSNLSGIFGKQGIAIFSNRPNADGYQFTDVTAEVADVDIPLDVIADYSGPAEVVGYTVSYNKEGISHGFVYCDTPSGARTVAKSMDPEILQTMTEEEFVGREVMITEEHIFS